MASFTSKLTQFDTNNGRCFLVPMYYIKTIFQWLDYIDHYLWNVHSYVWKWETIVMRFHIGNGGCFWLWVWGMKRDSERDDSNPWIFSLKHLHVATNWVTSLQSWWPLYSDSLDAYSNYKLQEYIIGIANNVLSELQFLVCSNNFGEKNTEEWLEMLLLTLKLPEIYSGLLEIIDQIT